jgi:hypothetical protein
MAGCFRYPGCCALGSGDHRRRALSRVDLHCQQYGLDALPAAFSFLLSLWVSLDGEARVRRFERLGWQVERVLAASCLSDAEEIHFAEKAGKAPRQPADPLPALPAGKPLAQNSVVALGLIGAAGRPLMRRHHRLRLGQPALGRQGLRARRAGVRNGRYRAGHRRGRGVRRADRIVLPASAPSPIAGPGSMPSPAWSRCCEERVIRGGVPFLGICVGMQLMASEGREKTITMGLGWIRAPWCGSSPRAG